MKRILFLLATLALTAPVLAQHPLYSSIRSLMAERYPAVQLDDRLLAVSTWRQDDADSRETNKSFEKVTSIYRVAKLRGGPSGLVGVTISMDGPFAVALATLRHDGITYLLPLDGATLGEEPGALPRNVVFDSDGNVIYEDLASDKVFDSILRLITR